MSQNAVQLPTTGTINGLTYTNDINAALDTLQTNQSGNSDPGAVGAYKFWADTTNNLLKIRNAANSAWVIIGALADLGIQSGAQVICTATGGTADAITATFAPVISALPAQGQILWVRAASANATTTPTFTPNSGTVTAYTIVKGAGSALVAGDIAGAGHWLALNWDNTLTKWVLLNPATGVAPSVAAASTSVSGIIQIATNAQVIALASALLAVTPAALAATLNVVAGGAPIYSCRAWACYNSVQATGTYSQSGTTVTASITGHGLSVNQYGYFTPTSGSGVSGWYKIVTVPDANTVTYTAGTSLSTSGAITRNIQLKAGGNIGSITYNGSGDVTVNFTTALDDAGYSVNGSATDTNSTNSSAMILAVKSSGGVPITKSTTQCRVITVAASSGTAYDSTDASIHFFR